MRPGWVLSRRPGKQPDAEGNPRCLISNPPPGSNHISQVENPDTVIVHLLLFCESCDRDLADAPVKSIELPARSSIL